MAFSKVKSPVSQFPHLSSGDGQRLFHRELRGFAVLQGPSTRGKPGCSVAVCLAWLLSETEALKGSRQTPSVWSSLLDTEHNPSRVAWNPNGRPYFCRVPQLQTSHLGLQHLDNASRPSGQCGFLRESFLLLHLNGNTCLLLVFFPPWTNSNSSGFLRPTKEEGSGPSAW